MKSKDELNRDDRKKIRRASKTHEKKRKEREGIKPSVADTQTPSERRRVVDGKASEHSAEADSNWSKSSQFFAKLQRQAQDKIASTVRESNMKNAT